MKALFIAFSLLLSLPAAAEEINIADNSEENLIDNKIYFFAHSLCQSCRDAFIYLETKHKNLNIPITDMKEHHNLELYKQCVKKFNIKNSELTLPLICMGDNYVMGWNNTSSPKAFEQALSKFSK